MSSPLSLEKLEIESGENNSKVPWMKTITPRMVESVKGDIAELDPIKKEYIPDTIASVPP